MAKFFSRCETPETVGSNRGFGVSSTFEERIVDGVHQLVKVGSTNVKDFIEASKEDTLIYNIIRRFENGDVSALNKVQGFYSDVSNMPSSLAEAQNVLISLENKFNSFPVDIKSKFDNSFSSYISAVSGMNIDSFVDTFFEKSSDNSKLTSEESGDVNE